MDQVETIPPEAVARMLIIRLPDEDLAKAPAQEHAQMWQREVDKATAILRKQCEQNGREIDRITVSPPFRPFGIIEGCTFKGLEGRVTARFKRHTQENPA